MHLRREPDGTTKVVWFIMSEQPSIDRGWDTADVDACLRGLGFRTKHVHVSTEAQACSAIPSDSRGVLAWPVCYTLAGDVDGRPLPAVLEDVGVAFIGAGARSYELNGRIRLKEALAGSAIRSPRYQIVHEATIESIPFEMPCVMKCEYSSESRGVRVVHSKDEAREAWHLLTSRFGQRVIVEEWKRSREFTVAYIPGVERPIIGALEFILLGGRVVVDEIAKCDNRLIQFAVPDRETIKHLSDTVCQLATDLSIDGHFRADFLQDAGGELYVIDINLMPQMHFSEDCLSYFPMALRATLGMDTESVVCGLLDSARRKWQLTYPEPAARKVACAAKLGEER